MWFKSLLRKSPPANDIWFANSQTLAPQNTDVFTGYYSIPKSDIAAHVMEYVACLETEESSKWCRCEWIIHPDDIYLEDHRRMRRGETAPDCPVHTKEGLLLYFFEWIFKNHKEITCSVSQDG